jgi:hypothetical protein
MLKIESKKSEGKTSNKDLLDKVVDAYCLPI